MHILWPGQQNKAGWQSLELAHLSRQHPFVVVGGGGGGGGGGGVGGAGGDGGDGGDGGAPASFWKLPLQLFTLALNLPHISDLRYFVLN
jgi:hypothetical protein